MTRRTARWASVVSLTAAIAGCACTPIDCVNGLYVNFDSSPTGTVRVDLLSPGANTVASPEYSLQCTPAIPCGPNVFFANLMPARFDIRVTTADGSRTSQFTSVQYINAFTGSENCGQSCTSATVSVRMPQ